MITPYFNDYDNFILYQGNTNTILTEITDKVDVVFADPPYFLSSQKQKFLVNDTKQEAKIVLEHK